MITWINKWMSEWVNYEWMNDWTNEWTNKRTHEREKRLNERMDAPACTPCESDETRSIAGNQLKQENAVSARWLNNNIKARSSQIRTNL